MAPILLTPAAALALVCAIGAARLAAASQAVVACSLALGILAMWRPPMALLVVAAAAPLGGAIAALDGMRASATDVFVLSALAGWLARRATRPEAWSAGGAAAAVWLGSLALASLLVQCLATFAVAAPEHLGLLEALYQWLTGISRVQSHPVKPGVTAAVRLLAGLGLFVMAAEVCRWVPPARIAVMLTAGSAAVAALNVNRFAEIVLRTGEPVLDAARALHRTVRISATIPDVNAFGALCALTLPVALVLALGARRADRLFGVPCATLLAAGLWLSGSRAAMLAGAVAAVAVVAGSMARRWPARKVLALVGILGMILLAVALWYPRGDAHTPQSSAWLIRRELAMVAMRMAAGDPVFGVGIGQFFDQSAALVSPALKAHYRAENAHNQWLQFLGELGLTGLAGFVLIVGIGLRPALGRLRRGPVDPMLMAVTFGTLAFLLSSLLMHPLLVAESSAAFWLALGICNGWGTGAEAPSSRQQWRIALGAGLASAAVFATVPERAGAVRQTADLEGVGIGFSRWQVDPAGWRFRIADEHGVLYVPAGARIRIPVRVARSGAHARALVRIDNRPAGEFRVSGDDWTTIDLLVPGSSGGARYSALRVQIDPPQRFHAGQVRSVGNWHRGVE